MAKDHQDVDDDPAEAIKRPDPWIEAITPDRIERALDGFNLKFEDDWGFERLAAAIQRTANLGRGGIPQSNKRAIAELKALSQKAAKLREGYASLGQTAYVAVFEEWERTTDQDSEPLQYYSDFIEPHLDRFQRILAKAAANLASQGRQATKWRSKADFEQRVGFAGILMGVFEYAYGVQARTDNWAAEYGIEHPWPDFFERIYRELFPDAKGLNRSEVLQEAARQIRAWKGRDAYFKWMLFDPAD